MENISNFKTMEMYYSDFENSGESDFFKFLEDRVQEAINGGNSELASYIESLQMEVANQEFYEKELMKEEKEERENWVYYDDEEVEDEYIEENISSNDETTLEEKTSSHTESEIKETLLEELSLAKSYLAELEDKMKDEDFHARYESFEIDDMWNERSAYEDRIEQLENEIYRVEMEDLGTSLTSMTLDEIKKEYIRLLGLRKTYMEMPNDGYEVDDLEWKINGGLIEMIEEYIKANPELSEFEEPSNDEIEALVAKEMKSKAARDAGFEVNEFGEIIRPSKSLEEISTDELTRLEEEMDQEISSNSEKIKQAQIDRLLAKQKIIRKQRETLKELEGQGIDFDD